MTDHQGQRTHFSKFKIQIFIFCDSWAVNINMFLQKNKLQTKLTITSFFCFKTTSVVCVNNVIVVVMCFVELIVGFDKRILITR